MDLSWATVKNLFTIKIFRILLLQFVILDMTPNHVQDTLETHTFTHSKSQVSDIRKFT